MIIIVLLVMYVSSQSQNAAGTDALSAQATADRIMPVGTVQIKLASANAGPRSGEEAYKAQCAACHDAGMLGAPKFGDAGAWGGQPHPCWVGIPDESWFYFVHSYHFAPEEDIAVIESAYPYRFAAAVARDNIFAIQCHPEKSHTAGLKLLKNFVHWDGRFAATVS